MVTPYALAEDWEIGVDSQPGGVVQLHVRPTMPTVECVGAGDTARML